MSVQTSRTRAVRVSHRGLQKPGRNRRNPPVLNWHWFLKERSKASVSSLGQIFLKLNGPKHLLESLYTCRRSGLTWHSVGDLWSDPGTSILLKSCPFLPECFGCSCTCRYGSMLTDVGSGIADHTPRTSVLLNTNKT